MKSLLTIVFLLIFVGCLHKPELSQNIYGQHWYEKNYILGETRTVYTGEPVLQVNDYYIRGMRCFKMYPSNDFTLSGKYVKKSLFDYYIVISGKLQSKYQSSNSTQLDGKNYTSMPWIMITGS